MLAFQLTLFEHTYVQIKQNQWLILEVIKTTKVISLKKYLMLITLPKLLVLNPEQISN